VRRNDVFFVDYENLLELAGASTPKDFRLQEAMRKIEDKNATEAHPC
jgi:hypothetical protein